MGLTERFLFAFKLATSRVYIVFSSPAAAEVPLFNSGWKIREIQRRTRQFSIALNKGIIMATVIHSCCCRRGICLFLATLVFAAVTLRAQVGNDNPTGPAGAFNGNVTTGCSYDPYTGNAKRRVTDIVVDGSIGSYPLAFTRTSNSRSDLSSRYQFGEAGNWRHSYSWSMEDSPYGEVQPSQYFVYFPDGRLEIFSASPSDTYFRAAPGVRERFQPLDLGTMLAHLVMPDGGKVEFTATRLYSLYNGQWYSYSYKATAIIDPYGQRTTLVYNGDGSLNTIQEPGGRWLQLIYVTTPWPPPLFTNIPEIVIDHVQASDGRVVQYNYGTASFASYAPSYTYLGNVVYPSDPPQSPPIAYYSYQGPNIPNYEGVYEGYPLLGSCDDPMYGGPMKKISYAYATGNNPDGTAAVYGQILSENSGTTGQAVSTLTVNSTDTRTETRGDGPQRIFNYGAGKLVNYSDFKGQTSHISYDGNGYTSAMTDARSNTTNTQREPTIGALSVLTHPGDNSTAGYGYSDPSNPYYLTSHTDERNNTTYYDRDGNNRIWRIRYPDGGYEEFSYNGFGQVTSHRMTNGGMETFNYDGRGMKYSSSDPDGATYYYYDGNDRLEHVTDARWNSTWFGYNARGQMTGVSHMDGSYALNSYNPDGTLANTTDELGHTTRYSYDDYKRVVSVTNPFNQATSFFYAQDWANSYVQTTSNPKAIWSPMGKATHFAYDENWRRAILREAAGSADDAWTFYSYDAAGNLTGMQDPRGNVTTFGYDDRNRRTSVTNALNQTTAWQYDAASNMIRETRPDQSFRRAEFDSMNRVIDTYGFGGEHIHYDRDLAGNVHQLVDSKGAGYVYYYDSMNRKSSAWYPEDATGVNRYDYWQYDAVGNVTRHDNPEGNVQIFEYDNRNRQTDSYWWDYVGQHIITAYDAANRVTNITTKRSEVFETSIAFLRRR